MFALEGIAKFSNTPWCTHGQITRVVHAPNETPPNGDIEYQIGFMLEGGFVSGVPGVDKVHFQDADYAGFLDALGNDAAMDALILEVLARG